MQLLALESASVSAFSVPLGEFGMYGFVLKVFLSFWDAFV